MKLSFRDLKQQKFTIDADPSETIAQVKEKIHTEKGWEAASQKLIYSGKILADANTVDSYKIEEKGFIVCMVSKPKTVAPPKPAVGATSAAAVALPATPAQATSTPAQPAAPQPVTANTTSEAPATPSPAQGNTATGTTAAAAGAPAGSGFNDPSAMLVGNRNEATVREMEAMGFPRAEAERALRAAFFNPDRAIEYLLNGIPDNVLADQRQGQQQQQGGQQQQPMQGQQLTSPAPAARPTDGTTPAPQTEGDEPINLFEAAAQAGQGGRAAGPGRGAGLGAGLGAGIGAPGGQAGQVNMDFLRQSPHFQHLRQLVQQQPAMLEPILQQVAEGNPQLAQIIGQNQEQFLQLLSEDIAGNEGAPELPRGSIAITEEEAAAIDRLCGLGFSRDRVIQAYFACDKNEELAANFLFEQPDEDDA